MYCTKYIVALLSILALLKCVAYSKIDEKPEIENQYLIQNTTDAITSAANCIGLDKREMLIPGDSVGQYVEYNPDGDSLTPFLSNHIDYKPLWSVKMPNVDFKQVFGVDFKRPINGKKAIEIQLCAKTGTILKITAMKPDIIQSVKKNEVLLKKLSSPRTIFEEKYMPMDKSERKISFIQSLRSDAIDAARADVIRAYTVHYSSRRIKEPVTAWVICLIRLPNNADKDSSGIVVQRVVIDANNGFPIERKESYKIPLSDWQY